MPYQKTLKLKISASAKNDLRDIAQYTFVNYGKRQVDTYLQTLYDAMELLTKNSKIGHSRNDSLQNYEVLNVEKHLLIFTVNDENVIITRILHKSRDIKKLF